MGFVGVLAVLGLLWFALLRSNRIGGPFTLVGENGQFVSSKGFRGRYELIYFGYTHCPDLCSLTLAHMAAALQRLGPVGQRIVPIFITIDPERDSPAVIRHFTQRFSKNIVGLTGTPAQIAHVAREFHVYYRRALAGTNGVDYDMDHSTSLYVMGPKGRFIAVLPSSMTVKDLAATLERVVGRKHTR